MNGITLPSTATYAFLFAHPDDDAFISGTMSTLVQNGAKVHGIWLTSGDFLGNSVRREKELRKAARVVGLEDSHIHLLRFPDLGLVRTMSEAAVIVTELFQQIQPDTIFCTAFEGGHPDHDSVNFLAYTGRLWSGIQAQLFEFPLYSGAGKPMFFRWLVNGFPKGDPTVLRTKLSKTAFRSRIRVLQCYPSQWMFMFPLRLASPAYRLRRIGEPFRPCPPARDHTMRPYPGRLNYERWFNSFMKIGFDDFRDSVIHTRNAKSDLYPGRR